MNIRELYPMVEYVPDFLPDHIHTSDFFWEAVQEFLAMEPELVTSNGRRLATGALRSPTQSTRMKQIAQLTKRNEKDTKWGPITGTLAALVAEYTGLYPDFAGYNFYRDGDDHILLHTDGNFGFGPTTDAVVVATVSLGASRDVTLREIGEHEKPATYVQTLHPRSLFVMRGECQRRYLHAIPRARTECGPRLSITFAVQQTAPIEVCDWTLFRNEDFEAIGADRAKGPIAGQNPMPVLVGPVHEIFARWKQAPDKYRALTPWMELVRSLDTLAYHCPEFTKEVEGVRITELLRKAPQNQPIPDIAFEGAAEVLREVSGLIGGDAEVWLSEFADDLVAGKDYAREIVERGLRKVM